MHKRNTLRQTGIALAVTQALAVNVSSAATITVNNAMDNSANCTFRDAVEIINLGIGFSNGCAVNTGNGPLGINDTIGFTNTIDTISLSQGEVLIESNVSINPGDSAITITSNGGSRLLNIRDATVSITSATLTGGSEAFFGGGIFANASSIITLINSTVSNNTANYGGGVFISSSQLILSGTTISDNSANDTGGGIQANSSTVTLINSPVSGNFAGDGGGIFANSGSEVFFFRSDVSGNEATYNGGGVSALSNSEVSISQSTISGNTGFGGAGILVSMSTATIDDSTISDNYSGIGGGLVSVEGSTVTLSNTTVSENSAYFTGGGIYASSNSFVTLNNSTVSANGVFGDGGGIAAISSVVTLINSAVSGNFVGNDGADLNFSESTLFATGNNLLGDSSKTSAEAFLGVSPSNANIIATSDGNRPTPITGILAPLANNGGRTQTHALVAGSPAVDAGNNAACAADPINNFDQRLEPRPLGSACDIGAFEGELDDTTFFVIPLPNGKSVIFGL